MRTLLAVGLAQISMIRTTSWAQNRFHKTTEPNPMTSTRIYPNSVGTTSVSPPL